MKSLLSSSMLSKSSKVNALIVVILLCLTLSMVKCTHQPRPTSSVNPEQYTKRVIGESVTITYLLHIYPRCVNPSPRPYLQTIEQIKLSSFSHIINQPISQMEKHKIRGQLPSTSSAGTSTKLLPKQSIQETPFVQRNLYFKMIPLFISQLIEKIKSDITSITSFLQKLNIINKKLVESNMHEPSQVSCWIYNVQELLYCLRWTLLTIEILLHRREQFLGTISQKQQIDQLMEVWRTLKSAIQQNYPKFTYTFVNLISVKNKLNLKKVQEDRWTKHMLVAKKGIIAKQKWVKQVQWQLSLSNLPFLQSSSAVRDLSIKYSSIIDDVNDMLGKIVTDVEQKAKMSVSTQRKRRLYKQVRHGYQSLSTLLNNLKEKLQNKLLQCKDNQRKIASGQVLLSQAPKLYQNIELQKNRKSEQQVLGAMRQQVKTSKESEYSESLGGQNLDRESQHLEYKSKIQQQQIKYSKVKSKQKGIVGGRSSKIGAFSRQLFPPRSPQSYHQHGHKSSSQEQQAEPKQKKRKQSK